MSKQKKISGVDFDWFDCIDEDYIEEMVFMMNYDYQDFDQ